MNKERIIFRWLDRHKVCTTTYPVRYMDKIVDKILGLMELDTEFKSTVPSQQSYLQKLRDHISVILCNLINSYNINPDNWIGFYKGKSSYKRNLDKKGFQFSGRNLNKVVDFLDKHGFISLMRGYPASESWEPEVSKMKASMALIDLITQVMDEQPLLELNTPPPLKIIKDYKNIRPVRMKGVRYQREIKNKDGSVKKKWVRDEVPIPFKYRNKVKTIGSRVLEINALLHRTDIDLDITEDEFDELNRRLKRDPEKSPVDLSDKYLYRIFHDNRLDRHGRFYGSWCQGIPEDYREKIMFDGMPSVEFDFKSLHPALLYCLEGEDIPKDDLYFLSGYGIDPEGPDDPVRKFIKRIMLIAINSENDDKTFRAFCKSWSQKRKKARKNKNPVPVPPLPIKKTVVRKILSELRERHDPIAKYFDDGSIGNILMNYDSQIAERVMMHFIRQGVPCLPVHDSFIVPVTHGYECYEVMRDEFKTLMGQEIPVDGSEIKAIKAAMERPAILGRSDEWDRFESEIIYSTKLSYPE